MKIYDSYLKQKVELVPIKQGKVRMYVCGPTVYDHAHLGHARNSISFDLLRRLLLVRGFDVIMAKNFTDIDDKLIKKSLDTRKSVEALSQEYIDSYLSDMAALNVARADLEPRATGYLKEICVFIESLLKSGVAYQLKSGDVYLEVAKDAKYGELSKHFSDEDSINRVESDAEKKDPRDFALWKAFKVATYPDYASSSDPLLPRKLGKLGKPDSTIAHLKSSKDDIGYDVSAFSSLPRGRPGWHIECSAMIDSALAYRSDEVGESGFFIDIHGGGADLFFPHHENEASQTRCLHGKEIAKYWIHNGFVNINGEKMSKSLGNSFFIKDALKAYHGEILRNYLLGTHYRSPLNFNEIDLLSSKKRLDKIYRLKKRVGYVRLDLGGARGHFNEDSSKKWDIALNPAPIRIMLNSANRDFCKGFFDALSDDLNISLAFSVIEDFLKDANEYLDSNQKDNLYKQKVINTLMVIDFTLGLGMLDYTQYFQLGISQEKRQDIESKIAQRLEAKKNRDFALADSIREGLLKEGITIMDKAGNITEWECV